ncbi:MAG: LemA family protein [Candidatus Methylacidiphilales bacterium]|nr:LemA family protein [Candidatus Methylacidiphilales bacterium]
MEIVPLLILLVLFVLLPLGYIIGQFNGLVSLRNHIRESWSNVDTELKRRHELIPNLVEVARGYAAHEAALFARVAELRTRALGAEGIADRSAREGELARGLGGLLALAENYPTLKADAHFLRLQEELVRTEDRIQAARRFYNGNVREYQNKCDAFPSNLVARAFAFRPAGYFEVDPAIRQVPGVAFD